MSHPKLKCAGDVMPNTNIVIIEGKNFHKFEKCSKLTVKYPDGLRFHVPIREIETNERLSLSLPITSLPELLTKVDKSCTRSFKLVSETNFGTYKVKISYKCTCVTAKVFFIVNPSCPPGSTLCGAECVNLDRDSKNCGSCGVTCLEGQVCIDGKCEPPAECLVNTSCINTNLCSQNFNCGGPFPNPTTRVVCLTPPACCTTATPNIVANYFSTIQAAVNASSPGDNVVVCPGTYVGQVTINVQSLTLISSTPLAATIQNPPLASGAIVTVTAPCVRIQDFTIRGPGPSQLICGPDFFGIQVTGAGNSAFIVGNRVTQITDAAPPFQCIRGRAIQVDSGASAIINNNTIDNYQRNAIRITGPGSCGQINNNVATGGPLQMPPTNPFPVAPNGIVISNGATGRIVGNTVTNNLYYNNDVITGTVATGIMLVNALTTCVLNNILSNNNVGIYLFGTTGAQVTGNNSSNNISNPPGNAAGIFVDDMSSGNIISLNTAMNNSGSDLSDMSVGTGSCGTANSYLCNNCVTDECLCASTSADGDGDVTSSEPVAPIIILD